MFRLTETEENGQTVFVIEGRLAGPAIAAIQEFLRQQEIEGRKNSIVVDLMGVTAIDLAAKALLAKLHARGAVFRAKGCLNRAIVEEITAAGRGAAAPPAGSGKSPSDG
jgi:ABC-type transporter Mla MlaB component